MTVKYIADKTCRNRHQTPILTNFAPKNRLLPLPTIKSNRCKCSGKADVTVCDGMLFCVFRAYSVHFFSMRYKYQPSIIDYRERLCFFNSIPKMFAYTHDRTTGNGCAKLITWLQAFNWYGCMIK